MCTECKKEGQKSIKRPKTKDQNHCLFKIIKLLIITSCPHLLNFLLGTGNKVLINVGLKGIQISELSDEIHYLASQLNTMMFLHIVINELHRRLIIIILLANMLFYPLYYDTISLTSTLITQLFHLLLGFTKNQGILKFQYRCGSKFCSNN